MDKADEEEIVVKSKPTTSTEKRHDHSEVKQSRNKFADTDPKKVFKSLPPKVQVLAPDDGPAPEVKDPKVFSASNFDELPLNNKLK